MNTNPTDEKVKAVIEEAFARYKAAESKYGVPDFDKDPRDFLREAEEELLDTINYAAFQILRLRSLRALLATRGEQLIKALIESERTRMKEAEGPTL